MQSSLFKDYRNAKSSFVQEGISLQKRNHIHLLIHLYIFLIYGL